MFSGENISQNKEIFKSTTGLEEFSAVFEFFDTGPHFEHIKFYDKSCPQDVKSGKKAKLLVIDQFFMYLSWSRNGYLTFQSP